MSQAQSFTNIVRRLDGSYVIDKNGHPYHVPEEGEWAPLWAEVNAYAALNPGEVTEEVPPPPPPPVPLETVVAAKLAEVMKSYAAAFAPIEAMYPMQEREGWPVQLEEARAVLADPEAGAPTLAVMVAERGLGETVPEFAQLVIGNNGLYRAVYAKLTGQQQRMFREVRELAAAGMAAEIEAYPVAYEMPEGIAYGI